MVELKEIFARVVTKQESPFVLKRRFVNILEGVTKNDVDTPLTEKEVGWLANNFDVIDRIFRSDKAIGVLWILKRDKETYVSDMARKLCSHTLPIRRWLKIFYEMSLVKIRESRFGVERYYYLNTKDYANVLGTFLALISSKRGADAMDSLTSFKYNKKNEIIDKHYESVKKIR